MHQERLRAHPVGVVGCHISAFNIPARKSACGGGADTKRRTHDQSLCLASEVWRLNAFQASFVDEELNSPIALCPASHHPPPTLDEDSRIPRRLQSTTLSTPGRSSR